MMKNSIKELTEGMQRLCAVANRIVSHSDNVSRIERDLLLEDLRRLYDVALRLVEEDENGNREVKSEMVEPDEEILSSTVMAARAAMGTVVPTPESMPEMETLEANDNALLFDEVVIGPEAKENKKEEVEVETEEKHVEESKPAQEPIPVDSYSAGTQASLLDYLKHPVVETPTVRTLGEKLGGVESGEGRVESGVVAGQKISDLRTVININDKFSFMSELFHNNMKAYNDFILRLNTIDTRDEALLCVNEVSAQYHWDESSLAVQDFYKVFDKKF